MKTFNSIKSIQSYIKKIKLSGKTIGFVPTMGALHEGHLSLVQKARRENDIVVASIFVNPIQFGPLEDLKKYPRQKGKDSLFLVNERVDALFYPTASMMYPEGYLTYIDVEKMTDGLCGQFRPGHFRGVTTVVGKLLNIVQPDIMYLGQKDAQQAAVLSRMVKDLNFHSKVKICPTIRAKDGLALSSRNVFLNEQQRLEAPILWLSLKQAKDLAQKQTMSSKSIVKFINDRIKNTSGIVQYIECVNSETLDPLNVIKGKVMIALAVKFGSTRLIDNIIFRTT